MALPNLKHRGSGMSPLSESSQCVVITALVTRRRQLQERVAHWAEVMTRSRSVAGAEISHEEATKHLQETEAAMIELDKRVVPWLHCHPDCADLFAPAAAVTGEVAQ